MRYILFCMVLMGCTSKYDDCIEKEKESYRASHPNASYGLIQSRQFEFELTCSKYKGK